MRQKQKTVLVVYIWAVYLSGVFVGMQDNPTWTIILGIALLIGNFVLWHRLGKTPATG